MTCEVHPAARYERPAAPPARAAGDTDEESTGQQRLGRRVRRRYRLPRRSRERRALGNLTRPGPVQPRCRSGSMRTGNRKRQRAGRRRGGVRAARQRRERRCRRKCRGNGNREARQRKRCNPAASGRIRKRTRRCGFPTGTRRSRSNSAPATQQEAGMLRPASIWRPSVSVDGCNAVASGSQSCDQAVAVGCGAPDAEGFADHLAFHSRRSRTGKTIATPSWRS